MFNPSTLQKLNEYIARHYENEEVIRAKSFCGIKLKKESLVDECCLEEICCRELEVDREPNLREMLADLDEGFSKTVLTIIDEKGLEDAKVYHSAGISRATFSQLRTNPSYQPSKMTALALCLGLKLNVGEANELLKRAGYTLSNSSKVDLTVKYCLVHNIYNLMTVNRYLFSIDQPVFPIN